MAVIAKVSIGQFKPGEELKGVDEARLGELIQLGYAEDDGNTETSKPAAKPKPTTKD